jgi:hypothetical protein
MKRCPYCGKEYSDEYSICAIDENPLESCTNKPSSSQKPVLIYIAIPVLLVGVDYLINPHFFSLTSHSIRLLFSIGLLVLISLVWVASWLQDKRVKRKLARAMKEALEREARKGKTTDEEENDNTVA